MRQRPRARKGDGRNPWTLQNGYAIRTFRELLGWSRNSLAAEIGIAPTTLSNLEAERRSTGDDVIERIADVLEIDVEAIRREKRRSAANQSTQPVAEAVA